MASPEQTADIIVIGAGMAGLAAARELADAGRRVVLLEARDRVGGRIVSQAADGDLPVELGAEFVHGKPPELWALIEEAGLQAVERDGAMLQELTPGTGMACEPEGRESLFGSLAELPTDADDPEAPDQTFAEWLDASSLDEDDRRALTGYVEGFNAADAARISTRALGVQQRADDAIEGDRTWHLPAGYARLPEFLAERFRDASGDLRLGAEVVAIYWRRGQVVVSTAQHGDFRAPRCVIALPLGVLQAANARAPGSVRLEPEPAALFQARRLAMGHVVRFTMIFRHRWWEGAMQPDAEALRSLSFAFTPSRTPPVWWTRHPESEGLPALTGWSGGPGCAPLLPLDAAALGALACRELAAAFCLPEHVLTDALLTTHTHPWTADRFSLGAYSYVPADALDASAALAEPAADTLFFAGEHTDTAGHWGTVHAALRSGKRVAAQILGSGLRDR